VSHAETKDLDIRRIDDAVAVLSEHYDTVQIFVTRYDSQSGETMNLESGTGNWFARRGQVDDWLDWEGCEDED
jgi:hypothetical protein